MKPQQNRHTDHVWDWFPSQQGPSVRTRLRLISFTITYYFPLLFNPVACESWIHIFDFTPLPHNSYHARSTSTRLSPSINRDSIVLGRLCKKQGRRRIGSLHPAMNDAQHGARYRYDTNPFRACKRSPFEDAGNR